MTPSWSIWDILSAVLMICKRLHHWEASCVSQRPIITLLSRWKPVPNTWRGRDSMPRRKGIWIYAKTELSLAFSIARLVVAWSSAPASAVRYEFAKKRFLSFPLFSSSFSNRKLWWEVWLPGIYLWMSWKSCPHSDWMINYNIVSISSYRRIWPASLSSALQAIPSRLSRSKQHQSVFVWLEFFLILRTWMSQKMYSWTQTR